MLRVGLNTLDTTKQAQRKLLSLATGIVTEKPQYMLRTGHLGCAAFCCSSSTEQGTTAHKILKPLSPLHGSTVSSSGATDLPLPLLLHCLQLLSVVLLLSYLTVLISSLTRFVNILN